MMSEDDDLRAAQIEARAKDYVHRSKRMLLELFGVEAAHEQTLAALNLASAMIQLEAAETIAAAQAGQDPADKKGN